MMKSLMLLGILLSLHIVADCKELRFVHQKNDRVTSFKTGDKVGIALKAWTFPNKISGVLTDFNESQIIINNKIYLFDQIRNIRHSKPVTDFIFGFVGAIALLTAGFLLIPLILPISGKNFTPFLIFLFVGYGSLITKEILTGYRVGLHKHTIILIENDSDIKIPEQNP